MQKKNVIADDNKYHNPKKQRTLKTGFFSYRGIFGLAKQATE